MEVDSAGESPPTGGEDMQCKDRGAKRDRIALEETTNLEVARSTVLDLEKKEDSLGNRDSYRSRLMNNVESRFDSHMEKGEFSLDDYDSDGDSLEVDTDVRYILLSKNDKGRIRAPLRNTLIVKLLGRSISYSYLCKS